VHLEVGAVPELLCTAQADTLWRDNALKAASGWGRPAAQLGHPPVLEPRWKTPAKVRHSVTRWCT